MRMKLSTIFTCVFVAGFFPVSVAATPAPISSATAWVKIKGNFQDKNTIIDSETHSLLQTWTSCKESEGPCEYVKLESVPFDLNGKMTITMNDYIDVAGGYIQCRAIIDVPFVTQNNQLMTNGSSFYAKWERINTNVWPGPVPDCPATLITLKVNALNNGINGYQFDINES